jgi:hypothetical protein
VCPSEAVAAHLAQRHCAVPDPCDCVPRVCDPPAQLYALKMVYAMGKCCRGGTRLRGGR